MRNVLRKSTATTVMIGPAMLIAGTPTDGLSIVQADILLSKNGGDYAAKSAAGGGTTKGNGEYAVSLDITDTGTLGRLKLSCYKVGCIPIIEYFEVIPAIEYDAMIAGTDSLQVDTVEISGTAQTAGDVMPAVTDAFNQAKNAADDAEAIHNHLTDTVLEDISAIRAKTDNLPPAPAATGDIPTAAANAAGLLNHAIAGYTGAGSVGEKINAAGGAADPWTAVLPGSYALNTAGDIIGRRLARLEAFMNGIRRGLVIQNPTVLDDVTVVYTGDYKAITINLGADWPLTGKEITFTAKVDRDDTSAVITKTATIVDADDGIASIILTPADLPTAQMLYYDVTVANADDSEPATAAEGILVVKKAVAK